MMGRKTKLGTQYMFAGIFVMLFVAMFFTKDYIMSTPEETDASGISIEETADGTYTGSSEGFGGSIEVEIVVADGTITDVEILSHSESVDEMEAAAEAIEGVPASIVENNSLEVDIVSGATITSDAVMQAVANALSGEDSEETESDDTEEDTEEDGSEEEDEGIDLDAIEAEDITYEDGTYTGSAEAFGEGDLEVEVTVEDGKIAEVLITEHSETEEVVEPAFEQVPEAIIRRNSADVDTVSGATLTSEAILTAVENALEDAQQ